MIAADHYVSLSDIQKYSDNELYKLIMYSAKDKNESFRALCTYWMCIMETNRRKSDEFPVEMDVISYVNIYDENKNIIFRYGNSYQMYIIDGIVLIYDDNWIPYIFSYVESDDRCVWKYFCVSRDKDNLQNIMN